MTILLDRPRGSSSLGKLHFGHRVAWIKISGRGETKWKSSGNGCDASQAGDIQIIVEEPKHFRVSIRKADRVSGLVPSRGPVFKSLLGIHGRHKHGVIDGASVLINENEQLRRGRQAGFRL